jgi:hypothetical protein
MGIITNLATLKNKKVQGRKQKFFAPEAKMVRKRGILVTNYFF